MSFMADRISRILRSKFGDNVDMAMQELHACFLSDEPIQITSPLIITQDGSNPPITFNMHTDGNNVHEPMVFNIVGGVTPIVPPPPGTEPISPPSTGGGGNAYAGTVTGGSGTTYTCSLIGSTGIAFTTSVSIPGLAPDATLPVGATFAVIKVGTTYVGLPAIFLEFS
jgi:hypothetical protein